MSHTRVALPTTQYPPLTADIISTTSVVNGQTIKVDVAVIDATRLGGASALTQPQGQQIIADTKNVLP